MCLRDSRGGCFASSFPRARGTCRLCPKCLCIDVFIAFHAKPLCAAFVSHCELAVVACMSGLVAFTGKATYAPQNRSRGQGEPAYTPNPLSESWRRESPLRDRLRARTRSGRRPWITDRRARP